MLEDLPDVPPIEKPLHRRKVRSLPAAKTTTSTSVWSSIETIAPSHSAAVGPSESGDTSPPQVIQPEESSAICSLSPPLSSVPPPAMYVECVGSGSSTPRTPRGGLSVGGTPRGNTPSGTTMRKRLAHQLDGGPASKRRLISSTSPSSSSTIARDRGLLDAEIASLLNYGSEEEMDNEEDVENEQPPLVIPRTARMYLEDEEEDNLPANNTTISLVWPPAAPSSNFLSAAFLAPSSAPPSLPPPTLSATPLSTPPPIPTAFPTSISSLAPSGAPPSTPSPAPSAATSPIPTVAPISTTSPGPSHFTPSPAPSAAPPSTLSPIPSADPLSPHHSTTSFNLEKFHFEWKGFPPSQIPPAERREAFKVANPGPTASYSCPYDAFSAIWDIDIMSIIAEQTNMYAQEVVSSMLVEGQMQYHSRINKWRDTTADELAVYFAIIMATGIVVKSRLDEYWNSTADVFQTPGFSAAMSIDRFLILGKCLHFNDNAMCNPHTMSRAEAKLYKIQPILNHLNNKFCTLYTLDRNIALDESLTMWKGWLDINQFIRNKAASMGIKTYEVCESQTGYLWRFEVHAGQEPSEAELESPISGKVASLVLRLLNGLENKGYTVWMDNFYNSPALARELKSRGFDCVGTLRTDRQFVPSELTNMSKRDMMVGQVCGCTSGDVDLILWRDKNRVAFVSTYHGIATTTCGETLKPSVVPDYNVCMGGVDRKDQMISMYPIERRRNRIWYKKLFRRLLNVSVLNAYILFKKDHRISHRNFRRTLVTELLARHGRAGPLAPRPRALPISGHHPAQYDYLSDKKHERHRRRCTVCKKRTNTFCNGCKKTLCIFTCFGPYHDALTESHIE